MTTKFFTNRKNNTLLNKFIGVFADNPQIKEFDALVGYFRATGYFKLRPYLKNLSQIRILIGIDVDKITQDIQQQGLALNFGANADQVEKDYRQKLKTEMAEADYKKDFDQSAEQFIEDIVAKKIILKAHPSKKIHAKIYIMRPQQFTQHSSGEVITGSSNLSKAGLGTGTNDNYEFNVLLRDYEDVKFATDEFEELWNEATDITPTTLTETKKETHLRDDITPFQLYIKLLIEYYGNEVDFDPNSIGDLPSSFKRLQYQMDAVEQGYQLLKKHNGFFLSDVVGLGKTIIAILIARRFFHYNNYPEYRSHILIICPPAVQDNWQETVKKFALDNVTIITNGSLHKIVDTDDQRAKYDLVIVDESHAFRNSNQDRYRDLEIICKTKCRDSEDKRVILVSATPMNNGPADIKNQLLLFQDSNDSTLDIHIESYFQTVIKKYKELLAGGANNSHKIANLIEDIRLKVIEQVTVRRTRTDLMQHDSYKQDLQQQGITFPKVNPPEKILYQLEPELNELYDHSVKIIAGKNSDFEYAAYRVIGCLKPEHKKDYNRADFIVARLRHLMKTLLLKRLDSSFCAFNHSLKRFIYTAEKLIKMFTNNKIYIAPNIDIDKYLTKDREEELLERLFEAKETDPTIKILTADDFEEELLPLLKKDFKVLSKLQKRWQAIIDQQPDPKLETFKQQLSDNIFDSNRNANGKCVIFSESAITTKYLNEHLKKQGYKVLAITAENRQKNKQTIKENFDANYDENKQKSDYDIIIATETLAEGINLHRANSIINYDTPWNATRLMQRIGRINRIGSPYSKIFIYNFFPTEQVEDDIGLKKRAQKKLQAFHTALGEDSQIYSTDEIVETFGLFDDETREEEKVTERFKYLEILRTFKRENPDEFRHIKNLPLKVRNAVTNNSVNNQNRNNAPSTICFLRNARHNAFYQVQNGVIKDIGFFIAVEHFERHKAQANAILPDSHYQQVSQCLEKFSSHDEQKKSKEQNPKLTPKTQQAINYLKGLQTICLDEEKDRLSQAIQWITIGRYQNFYKDINKIQKNSTQKIAVSIAKQLETVIAKINHYSKEKADQTAQTTKEKHPISKPNIVISQTYV